MPDLPPDAENPYDERDDTPDPPPDDLCAVVFRALHSSRNTQMSDEMRAAYIASVITAEEGAWPDQSAMHGVLLEQVKDAYTAGITDTVAKLRVRAANMLPEVASFTMDEIEAILGHAAPGICCAPHCWSEYGTPCGDCPADAERERQSDE